jgi:hypothetical protein
MFCAFEGAPNILRLYGRGEAIAFDDPGFAEALAQFPDFPRARGVITLSITRVMESCGWGVPFFDFKGERDQLRRWVEHKPLEEWKDTRYQRNALTVDGQPGLVRPDQD